VAEVTSETPLPVDQVVVRAEQREFLVFVLAGERYALEVSQIREIVSPPPITPVPRAPSDIVGVCSVRGLLVTLLDLRRRLRLEERPLGRRSRILLSVSDNGSALGLLVDEVRQVVRLAPGEIELASAALGGDVSEHVLGIARPQGDFLLLIDYQALVNRSSR
jgi:purine-binding chemotaxis protein CheW